MWYIVTYDTDDMIGVSPLQGEPGYPGESGQSGPRGATGERGPSGGAGEPGAPVSIKGSLNILIFQIYFQMDKPTLFV